MPNNHIFCTNPGNNATAPSLFLFCYNKRTDFLQTRIVPFLTYTFTITLTSIQSYYTKGIIQSLNCIKQN